VETTEFGGPRSNGVIEIQPVIPIGDCILQWVALLAKIYYDLQKDLDVLDRIGSYILEQGSTRGRYGFAKGPFGSRLL
jgi:hypothetical protein